MGSCRQEKDDIKTAQTYVVQFPHSAPTQHASQFSSQHASLLGGGSDPAVTRPPLDTCLCFQELVSILQDPTEVHIFVGFASFASSRYSTRELYHIFDSESKSKRYT